RLLPEIDDPEAASFPAARQLPAHLAETAAFGNDGTRFGSLSERQLQRAITFVVTQSDDRAREHRRLEEPHTREYTSVADKIARRPPLRHVNPGDHLSPPRRIVVDHFAVIPARLAADDEADRERRRVAGVLFLLVVVVVDEDLVVAARGLA